MPLTWRVRGLFDEPMENLTVWNLRRRGVGREGSEEPSAGVKPSCWQIVMERLGSGLPMAMCQRVATQRGRPSGGAQASGLQCRGIDATA